MTDEHRSLTDIADAISQRALPPVNAWQPEVTRDVDIRIARNGDWFYRQSRIDRPRMVKLFSTVLRVDNHETFLVTPQERLRIVVDDAPFTAVLVEQHGVPDAKALVFTTNVGDRVIADEQHPITMVFSAADGQPSPYVLVRDCLKALISRPAYYQLAEWAEERSGIWGVESRGCFMALSEVERDT